MVINLTIDGENLFPVGGKQRLSAAFRVHDGEAFMRQNSCLSTVDTTPVRTAVTDFLTHTKGFLPEHLRLLDIEYSYDSTHTIFTLKYVLSPLIRGGSKAGI